jgi:hypothetical protein
MSTSSFRGADSQQDEVELVVDLVRLSRLTLLYADASLDKSAVLKSAVLPLFEDDASRARKEIAVLFDTWENDPLAALIAQLTDVAAASIGNRDPGPLWDDRSLTSVLTSCEQELGISFIVILDRFEQHLSGPDDAPATLEFEEQLAAAVNDRSLQTRFLLALDEEAAPSLHRLRASIPALDDARVRLSGSGTQGYCVDGAPSPVEAPSVVEPSSRSESSLTRDARVWAGSAPLEAYTIDAAPFYGSSSEPQRKNRSESLVECLERMRAEYGAPTITSAQAAATFASIELDDVSARAEAAYADTSLRRIVQAKSENSDSDGHRLSTVAVTRCVPTQLAGSPQAASGEFAARLGDAVANSEGAAGTAQMRPEQYRTHGARDRYRLSSPHVHVSSYERYRLTRRVCLFGALGISVFALWLFVVPQYESAPDETGEWKESMTVSPGAATRSHTTDVTVDRRDPSDVYGGTAVAEPGKPVTSGPPAQQGSGFASAAAATQPADLTSARTRTVTRGQASAPKRSASATPAAAHGTPLLYIRVRSESQRARAERMIQPLARRGIHVTGIKVVDAGPPVADVRYFDPAERDGAVKIALALRDLGVSAQRLQQVSGSETLKGQRRFELWLSSATP